MNKFSAKDIKEKFIKDQIKNNLSFVEDRIQQQIPLADTFHDFAQSEGFSLDKLVYSNGNFDFSAYLTKECNSEQNDGQICFVKEDFLQAIEADALEYTQSKFLTALGVTKKLLIPTEEESDAVDTIDNSVILNNKKT